MGMTERDTDTVGGSLYNSLLYISAEGAILGVHRKLMPTHAERIVWGQGDGSGLLVVETGVGRVGGLICWEHWMPLSRFAMHAEREEIHVAAWPEVGDPEMHRFASRHYAFEGRCFSICVMGASMTAGALPGGLRAAAGDGRGRRLHRGRLGLGAARHDDLRPRRHGRGRRARRRGDDRLRRLDLGRIAEEQQSLDVVGHYNRPDIFDLRVDASSRAPVTWKRSPAQAAAELGGRPRRTALRTLITTTPAITSAVPISLVT